MKKRKLVMSLLCFFFALFFIKETSAQAATTGSNATGAKLPTYSKVVTINVSKSYISKYENEYYAIQAALNKARDHATNKVQYKIIIPTGTYYIDSTLKIYSNTYLYCESGVVLKMKANGKNGNILRCGTKESYKGYAAIQNIMVEGGTWDNSLLKNDTGYTFSNIRFAHATNIYFKGMTVKYNRNGHHMELAAVSGVTVEKCKFQDYEGTSGKEAIQIDVTNEEVFSSFPSYDNLPCKNVLIKGNKFYNVSRGFGSHSAIAGVYHTNVTVSGNTFDNIDRQAIMAINIKDITITKNKITNSGAGIEFKYFSDTLKESFIKISGLKYNHDSNANAVITNNTISTVNNNVLKAQYAIKIYGDTYSGSYIPKGDYYVSNVKISNNKITGGIDGGICLKGTYDSTVSSNTISNIAVKANNTVAKGIVIMGGDNNVIKKNTITSVSGYGITISDAAKGCKVTSNTIKSCKATGILVTDKGTKATLQSNTIKSNKANGIYITKRAKATVKSNTIKSNKSVGIRVDCNLTKGVTITSNKVSSNKAGNYYVASGTKATINGKVRTNYKK